MTWLMEILMASDKMRDKAFNVIRSLKYDGCQRDLVSMFYKFFNIKTYGSSIKNAIMSEQQLAKELHKSIITKFKERKEQSPFIENIWSADLADMQLISRLNEGCRFSLCVTDIYSKYAWVIPLKNKKGITISNACQKILKELNKNQKRYELIKTANFTTD